MYNVLIKLFVESKIILPQLLLANLQYPYPILISQLLKHQRINLYIFNIPASLHKPHIRKFFDTSAHK